ncbi:MAG: hypothetical protein ACE5I1_02020, partial [bacterium]
ITNSKTYTWSAYNLLHTHLFIIPNTKYNPDDDASRKPKPTKTFIKQIRAYLKPRRMITGELLIPRPEYVEIYVNATVRVPHGHKTETIKAEIEERLFRFLHPIDRGEDNRGKSWKIGEDLYIPDVFDLVRNTRAVSYVEKLDVLTDMQRPPGSVTSVRMALDEYEIICAAPKEKFTISVLHEEEAS